MFFKSSLFPLEVLVEFSALRLVYDFCLWTSYSVYIQNIKFHISSLWASFELWMWLYWLDIKCSGVKCLF